MGGRLTVQGTNFFPTADVPWRLEALGVAHPAGATWTVTAPRPVHNRPLHGHHVERRHRGAPDPDHGPGGQHPGHAPQRRFSR
ncbi:hypothetical protein [Nonomuraea salmonea]|uniref:hypothetical protein n=1 Tax=Nonomuraea salmonea TaxID=46181 RepID=UPI0031EE2AD5